MNLELALARCERYIDLQRGTEPVWSSHEMHEILVELAKMLALQVRPDQVARLQEEIDYLRTENVYLYRRLDDAGVPR